MSSNSKVLQKFHQVRIKNNEVILRLGRGKQQKKKKSLWNIDKKYWKPPKHPLISKTCLHAKYLCLNPLTKKIKIKSKISKAKRNINDPNASKGQHNSTFAKFNKQPHKNQLKNKMKKTTWTSQENTFHSKMFFSSEFLHIWKEITRDNNLWTWQMCLRIAPK
jgi:hypothetical protein